MRYVLNILKLRLNLMNSIAGVKLQHNETGKSKNNINET